MACGIYLGLGRPQVGQVQKALEKGHGRVLTPMPTIGRIHTTPGGRAGVTMEGSRFQPAESGEGVADAGAAATIARAASGESRRLFIESLQNFLVVRSTGHSL